MKKQTEQYPETVQTFVTDKGVKITVRRPILPPEERERRENRIKQAMCKLYENCRKAGIPWPGDPGYEEYEAEQKRLAAERSKPKRKKQKAV